jgi:hypothetical protein
MNKRIAAVLLVLSLIGLAAFAQDQSVNHDGFTKFNDRDWGVTFNVSGIINDISVTSLEDVNGNPAIQIRKFIKPNLAIRAGFGLNSFRIESDLVDSVGISRQSYDSTYKRTDFFIQPAIEYHFPGTKRLDPYVGAGLTIGTVGKEDIEVTRVLTDTTGSGTLTRNYDMPGGFTFGTNVIIGFNYFIAEQFALGAEYQLGFVSQRSGGDFTIVTQEDPISGASTTRRETGSNRTTNSGFRLNSTVGVTLSYFFNKPKKSS